MTLGELDDWDSHPCILEVDLYYPQELHDLHDDYPLASERLIVNKLEKLIPNLCDKENSIHWNRRSYRGSTQWYSYRWRY